VFESVILIYEALELSNSSYKLTAPSYRFMTDPSKQMKLRSTLPSRALILRDCAHYWVNRSSLLIYQNKDAVWQTFESDT
jgi:hypothetical protein